MKEVEMIATIKKGNIIPHRMRLENENGELQVIEVRHVRYKTFIKREKKIKYCIKAVVNGFDRELILWYYIESCNWYVDI